MSTPSRYFGRKAAKATAKHSARGVASKTRRQPLRTTTLLALGALAGALGGWFAARATAGGAEPSPAS